MNRRAFLSLLAGAAVATQLPESVLEKQGDLCIRYVRVWDVMSNQVVIRIDVARQDLPLPKSVDHAYKISNVPPSYLKQALRTLKARKGADGIALSQLEQACRYMKADQHFGVSYPEAA